MTNAMYSESNYSVSSTHHLTFYHILINGDQQVLMNGVTMSKMTQCQKCHNVKISSSDDHQVMIYGVIAEQANAPSAHCLLVRYQGFYSNCLNIYVLSPPFQSTRPLC